MISDDGWSFNLRDDDEPERSPSPPPRPSAWKKPPSTEVDLLIDLATKDLEDQQHDEQQDGREIVDISQVDEPDIQFKETPFTIARRLALTRQMKKRSLEKIGEGDEDEKEVENVKDSRAAPKKIKSGGLPSSPTASAPLKLPKGPAKRSTFIKDGFIRQPEIAASRPAPSVPPTPTALKTKQPVKKTTDTPSQVQSRTVTVPNHSAFASAAAFMASTSNVGDECVPPSTLSEFRAPSFSSSCDPEKQTKPQSRIKPLSTVLSSSSRTVSSPFKPPIRISRPEVPAIATAASAQLSVAEEEGDSATSCPGTSSSGSSTFDYAVGTSPSNTSSSHSRPAPFSSPSSSPFKITLPRPTAFKYNVMDLNASSFCLPASRIKNLEKQHEEAPLYDNESLPPPPPFPSPPPSTRRPHNSVPFSLHSIPSPKRPVSHHTSPPRGHNHEQQPQWSTLIVKDLVPKPSSYGSGVDSFASNSTMSIAEKFASASSSGEGGLRTKRGFVPLESLSDFKSRVGGPASTFSPASSETRGRDEEDRERVVIGANVRSIKPLKRGAGEALGGGLARRDEDEGEEDAREKLRRLYRSLD